MTVKCSRTACHAYDAICWHVHLKHYYCVACARSINLFGECILIPKNKEEILETITFQKTNGTKTEPPFVTRSKM